MPSALPARAACLLLTFACSLPFSRADAHVGLAVPAAPAGSVYRATFKVGHGCEGSPVTTLTVRLPADVRSAKPMPKPGWTLERRIDKLAVPYRSHGRTLSEDVTEITWRGGPLPDGFYDEFVMQVQLPETPGPRWFVVRQVCEQGAIDWAEVPAGGSVDTRGLKAPAVLLQVEPAAPAAHRH